MNHRKKRFRGTKSLRDLPEPALEETKETEGGPINKEELRRK